MKTMRFILVNFMLFIAITSSAQKMATVESDKVVKEGVTKGLLSFTFPAEMTKDEVTKIASYYVQYFSVDFDEKKHSARVQLVENDARNRMIIMRFLTASGIDKVQVGNVIMTTTEFNTTYLK